MTRLLDDALEALAALRRLPADAQDDIARVVLQLAGYAAPPVPLTPDERVAVEASRAQAARGEFASEAEVRAVWAKLAL
jgi:hypothetical protein